MIGPTLGVQVLRYWLPESDDSLGSRGRRNPVAVDVLQDLIDTQSLAQTHLVRPRLLACHISSELLDVLGSCPGLYPSEGSFIRPCSTQAWYFAVPTFSCR